MNIKLQRHHRKRSSESIDQRRDMKKIDNRHQKKNNHELHQKANLQRDEITMVKCLKKQHQEEKSVSRRKISIESTY